MISSNQLHDRFAKNSLRRPEAFKAFLRMILPPTILSILDLNSLTLCNQEFICKRLQLKSVDVLYEVHLQSDSCIAVYILVEHQSYCDRRILTRVSNYLTKITQLYQQQHGYHKYPIVIPIVYYHGKTQSYPYNVNDIFTCNDNQDFINLGAKIHGKHIYILNIWNYTIKELSQISNGVLRLFLIAQKLFSKPTVNEYEFNLVAMIISELAKTDSSDYLSTALEYLHGICDYNLYKRIKTVVENHTRVNMEDDMHPNSQLAHDLRSKYNEGVQQGIQQVARTLLKSERMDPEKVAKLVGIDLSIVEDMAKDLYIKSV